MIYSVSTENIHIEDSYAIRGRDFDECLKQIKEEKGDETIVFDNRSMFSLKMEWGTHNFLYLVHYKRPHTKDVDLNFPCDRPEWVYMVVGVLTWIFIR